MILVWRIKLMSKSNLDIKTRSLTYFYSSQKDAALIISVNFK